MIKLSDTQLVILGSVCQQPNRLALPLPGSRTPCAGLWPER
jgi:hypothetical protein